MKFKVYTNVKADLFKPLEVWVKNWDDIIDIEADNLEEAIKVAEEKDLFKEDFPTFDYYDYVPTKWDYEIDYETIGENIYHLWYYIPEDDNETYTVEYWILPEEIPEEYKKHFAI